ncbi:TetR/AcrR family transcriptional regulator [Actinoplanes couchii]|uniref:TetR family transcriptional regulator n=1 Tax=Actinoplanes couchii TaxID=403638 RepID=A0ABQ3XFZ8_9ACTN|nr:TetR/AcrR family transcriptional regulator [Actinoplanes couchii]MDR6320882.1 AcrR family transcriptional regulator [Actinoplanes couchii]GID57394.1 TetR family transcriptional regulator [Actinoplanes couchii]
MGRWQGGASERLKEAALGLFSTRGYDRTTVAEIAAAAGVTERTFFRHYADKREVLFVDQTEFERAFLSSLPETGDDPMRLIAAVLDGAATLFPEERRAWSRARQTVITTNVALQERELLKMSTLALTLTRALTTRGIDPTSAALAAESGVTVFRTAFTVWVTETETRTFPAIQQTVLTRLHALIG